MHTHIHEYNSTTEWKNKENVDLFYWQKKNCNTADGFFLVQCT